MEKKPKCHNCGRIVALKAGKTFELALKEEFRRKNPDTPEQLYLCGKCGNNPELFPLYQQTPWYAGYKMV